MGRDCGTCVGGSGRHIGPSWADIYVSAGRHESIWLYADSWGKGPDLRGF
jgi:hypothetical protein